MRAPVPDDQRPRADLRPGQPDQLERHEQCQSRGLAPHTGLEEASRCVGNLPKSLSGTLDDPLISEEGRRFLAGLLAQLTDTQIGDLFDTARIQLRLRNPDDLSSGFGTVGEWTAAFKQKRNEIASRRCL